MSKIKPFFLIIQNKLFLFIFIIIIVNNINILKCIEDSKKIIVIPFKVYQPKVNYTKQKKQTNLLNSWLRQKIYLDLENSSGQKLSMILTLDQINSHSKENIALISSEENHIKIYIENIEDICSFNSKISPNFKCQTPNNIFLVGRGTCCIVEEKLIFYTDTNLSEKKIYPFKFIHTTNQTNICFFGSLQKYLNEVDKSKSFMDQMKKLSGAETYTWTLKYTSENSGLFIFGDIIDNEKVQLDKKNKVRNIDNNYESIYSVNVFSSKIFWQINSDKLFFGNKILGENIISDVDTDLPFILLKREYYRAIKEQIFNKSFEEKICDKNIPEFKLSAISCNKKKFLEKTNNLKNIPSLTFQIKQFDLNITFTPNDLFRIEGDDIYFMVAHHSYRDSHCTLGTLFLKKYAIIFDNDSKSMKILKSSNNEEDDVNNNQRGGKIFLILILTIILSGIIFGFIGLKYGKKIYQSRKKKANELDDNYEYSQYSGKNDINYEKKNGLFINNEENKNNNMNSKGIILEMT